MTSEENEEENEEENGDDYNDLIVVLAIGAVIIGTMMLLGRRG